MLPDFNVPTLTALLTVFRPCFTAPGYRTFTALVVDLIGQTRRRTICGTLLGAGLAGVWHHSKAHRFFAAARWCADQVGLALADAIVAVLLDPDAPLVIVVDDTLFKRSGKKVFGTAWHHDGAAKGPKPIGFSELLGRRGTRRHPAVQLPPGVPAGAVPAVAAAPEAGNSPSPGNWRSFWPLATRTEPSTSWGTPPTSASTCGACRTRSPGPQG